MTPEEAWSLLRTASATRLEVRAPMAGPVVVRGGGTVAASIDGRGRLVTRETGTWTPVPPRGGRPTTYTDALRWTLDDDGLVVEQVRRGEDAPVVLGRLVPAARRPALTARHPHRCGADRYGARLDPADGGVVLTWSVRGPRKDQRLMRTYLPRS